MNPMNPADTSNPANAGDVAGVARDGDFLANALKPFRAGEVLVADMSAPSVRRKHTIFLPNFPRAEFIVKPAPGLTGYTIHYGRWVYGKGVQGNGSELDGWVEIGSQAVVVATNALGRVVFETFGDAVGVYIASMAGTPDADTNCRIWVRGAPTP